MSESLFRPEAVKPSTRRRIDGDVFLTVPTPMWVYSSALAAFVVIALLLALFVPYPRAVTGAGFVVPDRGLSRVVAPTFGVVDHVWVSEGQRVKAGAPLVRLSTDIAIGEGASLMSEGLGALQSEEQRLQLQRQAAVETASARQRSYAAQIASVRGQLADADGQIALQQQRSEIARDLLERVRVLEERGFSTPAERSRREETYISQQQELQRIRTARASLIHQLRQLGADDTAQRAADAGALASLDERLDQLSGQRGELSSRGARVLVSPVDGEVAAVLSDEGASVPAERLLVAVLPAGAALEAEIFVPSRYAGFVRLGQRVRIRYEAFSYRRFGIAEATITRVSRTVLAPGDLPPNLQSEDSMLRVHARIERPYVEAGGARYPLQAGMKLEATIITGATTFADALLTRS
jgi:membrane fusion protein